MNKEQSTAPDDGWRIPHALWERIEFLLLIRSTATNLPQTLEKRWMPYSLFYGPKFNGSFCRYGVLFLAALPTAGSNAGLPLKYFMSSGK